ncbi:MAG: uroporphyrinogen decarboxylase family protein [Promethearchaeota archaeon]
MDLIERFQIALRREGEPDRVPSFCQGIMQGFVIQWDEKYGDDIEFEDIAQTDLKDFTIYRHLGFDSSWCGIPAGTRIYTEESNVLFKKMNAELDEDKKRRGYAITRSGAMVHHGLLNGFPYTFTHEGVLKTKELWDAWYGGSYLTDPPSNAVEMVNRTLKQGLSKGVLPIFSSGLISEPLIQTISVLAAAKWSRKDPAFLRKVFDTFFEATQQRLDIFCQSDAPIIIIPDDCAYKNRPMYSPKFYEEFIIPYWRKITKQVHKHDKLVIFHSDGFVEPYYPLLIDAGVDAHQSLEPTAGMDLKHLKETYGDKLTLIGNIDVSRLIPYGTKEEVIEATKKCLKDGAPGGGYIFSTCSDLTNSCKLENAEIMMQTYKKYRDYPIQID